MLGSRQTSVRIIQRSFPDMPDQASLFGDSELPPTRAGNARQERAPGEAAARPAEGAREQGEAASSDSPLAARMRPRAVGEIVGQEDLLAADRVLRKSIEGDRIP